jgi:hypothetical protein
MLTFNKTRRTAVLSLLISALSLSAGGPSKIGSPAPELALKDQFEKEFRLSAARGEMLLLVCGDKNGSNFTGNWSNAVRSRFESNGSMPLRIVPIANLSGVPSFLRGLVKKRFVGNDPAAPPKLAILLDWEGDLERLYGFTEDLANVYLIDQSGNLQFVAAGKGTDSETKELVDAIARLLPSK